VKHLLRVDWDVIAGIVAAVAAIILHLLHIVEADVVFTIVLVLLAVLLFRDLRRESLDERVIASVEQLQAQVDELRHAVTLPDAELVGPRRLRDVSRRFAESASGEVVWYNVCFLMFQSQELFDLLLRPMIDNPRVETIRLVADESERDRWKELIEPRVRACGGSGKVPEPQWRTLPRTISFVLADHGAADRHGAVGATEALVSFWGEPFMARTIDRQVPRYIFHVRSHSDLIAQMVELDRQQRLGGTVTESPGSTVGPG